MTSRCKISRVIDVHFPAVHFDVICRLLLARARTNTHFNSLFTPPTRTRQNCLLLSVSAMWRELATRQDSFVLSRPSFQFNWNYSVSNILRTTDNLEIGNWSRQDKTVSCLVSNCVHTDGMDNTRQFCLVRVGGVNKLQLTLSCLRSLCPSRPTGQPNSTRVWGKLVDY